MDDQSLLPTNKSNEETGQNLNQQPITPTPVLHNNQNNDDQIPFNTCDIETANPQLADNSNQAPGFILPSNIDFSKYTNINQLNHRRINQIDSNTFNISKTCDDETCNACICFVCIIAFIIVLILGIINDNILLTIFGAIMILIGICAIVELCCNLKSVTFILGPNDITVEEMGCDKKVTKFYAGQLSKVEITCQLAKNDCVKYSYKILFKMRNNAKDKNILEITGNNEVYTPEEIGYFNYVMNHHIQTKM